MTKIYRGYDLEQRGLRWIVSKAGQEVHKADTEEKAMDWVDAERKRAMAGAK